MVKLLQSQVLAARRGGLCGPDPSFLGFRAIKAPLQAGSGSHAVPPMWQKNAQEGRFHDKQDGHDTRKHFENIYMFDGSLHSLGSDLPRNRSSRNGI